MFTKMLLFISLSLYISTTLQYSSNSDRDCPCWKIKNQFNKRVGDKLNTWIADHTEVVLQLKTWTTDVLTQQDNKISKQNSVIKKQAVTINMLQQQVNIISNTIQTQAKSNTEQNNQVDQLQVKISNMSDTMERLNSKTDEHDRMITEYNSTIAGLNTRFTEQNAAITGLNSSFTKQNAAITGLNTRFTEQNTTISMNKRECGPAPSVIGGDVLFKNYFKNTVTYTCITGYELYTGPLTVECLNTGSWTTPPTCKATVTDCGPAIAISNGSVSITKTILHTTATYTCNPGYELHNGSLTVQCLYTGLWSTPPTCKKNKTCYKVADRTFYNFVRATLDISVNKSKSECDQWCRQHPNCTATIHRTIFGCIILGSPVLHIDFLRQNTTEQCEDRCSHNPQCLSYTAWSLHMCVMLKSFITPGHLDSLKRHVYAEKIPCS